MSQTHSLDLESGSSQYASIADASQTGLDVTGALTMEAWIKLESLPASNTFYSIVGKRNGDAVGNQAYWFAYWSNAGTLQFEVRISDGTTEKTVDISHTLTAGVWYHVAATYNPSTSIEVFVNGRSIGSNTASIPASIVNNTTSFRVGASLDGASTVHYFDGLIKDVRIFNAVRTQTEIVSDARTENVSSANLKGEWNFNNAYTDSSGNSNTLTASGSPVFSTDRPWVASTQISGSTYLETSLTSYFTLDESSGNASDSTASANTLTNNGTMTYGAAKINNGAVLEAGKYLSRAEAILGVSSVALSFWINLPDTSELGGFVRFGSIAGSDGWGVGVGNTQYDAGAGNNLIMLVDGVAWRSFGALGAAGWKHIVVTRDATTWTAYVNGIQLASTFTDTPNAPNALTYVGNDQADWAGTIDEIAMYSRHAHYGDVLDLYNAGSGITYTAAAAAGGSSRMLMGMGA